MDVSHLGCGEYALIFTELFLSLFRHVSLSKTNSREEIQSHVLIQFFCYFWKQQKFTSMSNAETVHWFFFFPLLSIDLYNQLFGGHSEIPRQQTLQQIIFLQLVSLSDARRQREKQQKKWLANLNFLDVKN